MNFFNIKHISKFLSMLMVVVAMVSVTACQSSRTEKSTGEHIDDAVISTKVRAAIVQDKELDLTELNVETFKGVVQLSGFVADAGDASKAVRLARDVKGVVSVKNDIRVK